MNSAPTWKSEVPNSGLRQPVPDGKTCKDSDKGQGGGKFFYLCTYFSYECSLKMFTCYAFLANRLIIFVVLMKFGIDDWESESRSVVSSSATPWTVTRQAPLSMGFSRQEYWSGLPFPPPGDLPNPGIKPMTPVSPALAGRFFTTSAAWEDPVDN